MTIAGESAGALSVMYLMASPRAQGLFQFDRRTRRGRRTADDRVAGGFCQPVGQQRFHRIAIRFGEREEPAATAARAGAHRADIDRDRTAADRGAKAEELPAPQIADLLGDRGIAQSLAGPQVVDRLGGEPRAAIGAAADHDAVGTRLLQRLIDVVERVDVAVHDHR